jgi:hypothetical protein
MSSGSLLLVIGLVKTRTFEDYSRTAADKPFNLAAAFGAFGQRFIRHFLEMFERVIAFGTLVIVCRHLFLRI